MPDVAGSKITLPVPVAVDPVGVPPARRSSATNRMLPRPQDLARGSRRPGTSANGRSRTGYRPAGRRPDPRSAPAEPVARLSERSVNGTMTGPFDACGRLVDVTGAWRPRPCAALIEIVWVAGSKTKHPDAGHAVLALAGTSSAPLRAATKQSAFPTSPHTVNTADCAARLKVLLVKARAT